MTLRFPRWQRIGRATLAAILAIVALGVVYLLLLCRPGIFFRHSFTDGVITLYSDEPIPSSATRVLDLAKARLKRSPFFRQPSARPIRVYVCNTSWRFLFFANTRYQVGGLAYPPLSNNIFLRGVHFDANRLIGPSGNEVPGERTLSYYIAHEVMHTLVADQLGAIAYWRLPSWKNEGYADYIAKGNDFDFDRVAAQFRRGDRELDPVRSGMYLRYHLLVAYLLDYRGIEARGMLTRHFDQDRLEEEIRLRQAEKGTGSSRTAKPVRPVDRRRQGLSPILEARALSRQSRRAAADEGKSEFRLAPSGRGCPKVEYPPWRSG
jgi:hypothetical protein